MGRKRKPKRPAVPSDADILEQLETNFLAQLGLQIVNATTTEEKFDKLTLAERKKVKEDLRKYGGLTPDQRRMINKQKGSKTKKK